MPNLSAQFCPDPPPCLVNGNLETDTPAISGNMNTVVGTNVNGWVISHGTPTMTAGFQGSGVWMWARTPQGGPNHGEGIFACFDFQQGQTYQISFKAMNTSANNSGNLNLRAVNGLTFNTSSVIPAVPTSSQVIHNTHINTTTWQQYMVSFTPNADYTGIWINPFSANDFVNGLQYEVAVDDIWIDGACLRNGNIESDTPNIVGDMNTGSGTDVEGWGVSHGTPALTAGYQGNGVSMWARTKPGGVARGEGIFTCYNFHMGHTYQICFRVMNTTGNNNGNLFLRAVNGLVINSTSAVIPSVPASSHLIHGTHINTTSWQQYTVSFTPNADYSMLWIYPFSPDDIVNGQLYEVVVDDIQINETQPVSLSLTASLDSIGPCDSSILIVQNALPGSTYFWYPSDGLSSTTGPSVIATPCSTTTYSVEIHNPCTNSPCSPIVVRQVTVNVLAKGTIINNSSPFCYEHIDLVYSDSIPCPGATYAWYGPRNPGIVLSARPSLYMPSSIRADVGVYLLVVTSPRGCVDSFYATVIMDCCAVTVDFDIVDCNPVRFVNQTTTTNGNGLQGEWHWDFGDGATSSLKNPSHLYTSHFGPTTVCLTAVLYDGETTCCAKVCKDFDVCDFGCDPKAAFSYTIVDPGNRQVQFTDHSVGSGTPCGWEWYVDGILISTLQNPLITLPPPPPGGTTNRICLRVEYCPLYGANCFEQWCEDIEIP